MARKAKTSPSAPLADAQSSRDAILAAALQTFARDGYDGASMPKIARLANVAPPLIHYHFGSKDRLWREAVVCSLGDLRRETTAICQATRALAPLDRLRALLQAHTQFAARWPDHFCMIIAEARSDSERFAWVQENYTGVLFEEVLAILRDARDAGAIRDVPLEQLAITLFGGILVYFTFYPSKADRSSLEQAANGFSDTMFDLLLRGVAV